MAARGVGVAGIHAQFQSLLSWISRFGDELMEALNRAKKGFNPCCLGLAVLARMTGTVIPDGQEKFQSLLSWISRFGNHEEVLRREALMVSIVVVLD